ncbi:MAG: multidrug DMT transporter permease [Bacteroidota bacterium]
MLLVSSYYLAVGLLFITMLCWGSWANTQKLATQKWPFQLFYWDYTIGIVLLALVFGLTLGSMGESGRSFLPDLAQANSSAYLSAFVGGVIFNIANLLLVAAIDIAGMAVAFPVGIGLALVIGVIDNYIKDSQGNATLLFMGVALVAAAIVLNALSYGRMSTAASTDAKMKRKGILFALLAGITMGFFFGFVASSTASDFVQPEAGKFTPYSAVFVFSIGILISNFLWNTIFMYQPPKGEAVSYNDYFKLGTSRLHWIGILGGAIWCVGMSLSILCSDVAGAAIAYGLGQGATLVAAFWGVFVWKEFAGADKQTKVLIALMFVAFIIGLGLIIFARF